MKTEQKKFVRSNTPSLSTPYQQPSYHFKKKGVGVPGVLGEVYPPPTPHRHTINQPIDPRVTTTPPHPKYQNNNVYNNQMKISKFDLSES